jgi:hypothetical protein
MKYRIMIGVDGGPFTPMITEFWVWQRSYPGAGVLVQQTPDADGWYHCLEDFTATPMIGVEGNALGYFQSSGDGHALIYIEAKDGSGPLPTPAGVPSQASPKLIRLDNTAPVTTVEISSGGGSCGDFLVGGDPIEFDYTIRENERRRGEPRFTLEPPSPDEVYRVTRGPRPGSTTPTTDTYEEGRFVLTTQVAGTEGLAPCGYVVRVDGYDSTIVNSAGGGWGGSAFTGFCLKTKQ